MTEPAPDRSPALTAPCVLIANPHAGKGRGAAALEEVQRTLANAGADLRVHATGGPRDAARLAAEAAGEGVGLVVAVGGDGTLHEVVNGIAGAGLETPPALGVVPVGTGNDYAKMLGVPGRDPAGAARVLLEGYVWEVDAGRLEGTDQGDPEFFCNNVGLAFMAEANAAHERSRHLPGRLSYVVGGFGAFLRFRAERFSVRVDEAEVQGRYLIIHIGLGRYCGGGVCLTPDARLDDGKFEVCVVTQRSKLKGVADWPKLSRGEATPDRTLLVGARVRIDGPRDTLIHADGEVRRIPLGILKATLLPKALRVVRASPVTVDLGGAPS